MASPHWRTGHTVASLLQKTDIGWNFLQLVRVLLCLGDIAKKKSDEHDKRNTIGSHTRRRDKNNIKSHAIAGSDNELLERLTHQIQFRASVASDFPPGEIRNVDYKSLPARTEVTTVGGVLSSPDGPLPEPFITWVQDMQSRGNHAMADFFDLFNNRIQALRYVIGRATRPILIDVAIRDSDTGRLLLALVGKFSNTKVKETTTKDVTTESKKDELQRETNAALSLAGLFANCRLSLPIMRQLFLFSMGLNLIEMRSLQGGWLAIDEADHSRLGDKKMCRLGESSGLGMRVWDQQKSVGFVIGPLSWVQVNTFSPGGPRYRELELLLRRITDCRADCLITFLCPQNQIPALRLDNQFSLGLTTILPIEKQPTGTDQTREVKFTVNTAKLAAI